jgi:hypothetical protein
MPNGYTRSVKFRRNAKSLSAAAPAMVLASAPLPPAAFFPPVVKTGTWNSELPAGFGELDVGDTVFPSKLLHRIGPDLVVKKIFAIPAQ